MSSGHGHPSSFGLNSGALDRLLKNEGVRAAFNRAYTLVRDCDLPYIAGYSDDASKIYIDRHLPEKLKIDVDGRKIEFDPTPFLVIHESFEKALIDSLGYHYEPAHNAATGLERRYVIQALGPGVWTPYQKVFDKWAKHDEHEKLQKLPKDLDMTPYLAPPVDHKLLNRMEKVMGLKKGTKEESNYNAEGGTPRRHCGPDEGWPHGFCKSYREENRCVKVTGFISHRAICDWWHKGD